MKKIYCIIADFIIHYFPIHKIIGISTIIMLSTLLSNLCEAQWVQVTDSNSRIKIWTIQFTSENTGYAAGTGNNLVYGELFRTTNSGLNWQITPFPTYSVDNIYFLNDNTGILIGWIPMHSYIFKTTNAGINWICKDSLYSIFCIKFYDYNTGFVVAKYSSLKKTTNGGENWFSQTGASWMEPSSLCCTDANTWLVASTGSNKLNKTTNGGINWSLLDFTEIELASYSLYFINNTTGFSASLEGKIFKTTNTGENWFQISNIDSFRVYGNMQFINDNTGYIGGYGYRYNDHNGVFKTTDGGYNWKSQMTAPYSPVYSIDFINANTGCAGDYYGRIFRTTNGGNVFINNISSEIPGSFSLSQNYPNPFNPNTKIKFDIPRWRGIKGVEGSMQDVTLKIYDILGKEVSILVNEKLQPGNYEVTFDGSNLPSGIYFYRLVAGDSEASSGQVFSETKKMILIK